MSVGTQAVFYKMLKPVIVSKFMQYQFSTHLCRFAIPLEHLTRQINQSALSNSVGYHAL